jgi:hypothetical protein
MARYDIQVFLNVPFDKRYKKLLDALVFAVSDCGLVARCALEKDDGGQVRVEKLYDIIRESRAWGVPRSAAIWWRYTTTEILLDPRPRPF